MNSNRVAAYLLIYAVSVAAVATLAEFAVRKKDDTIRLLRAELANREKHTPKSVSAIYRDPTPPLTHTSNFVLWGAVTADIPEMRKFETDIPQTNIAETIVVGEDDQEYGFKLQTPGNVFEVKHNSTNVFVITQDCRIEYNCPPTEAAKLFLDALTNIVGAYRTRLSLKDQP